ncbi:MAG: hypothetical protein ACQETE_09920 [Bacteroidota bacterium]
MHHNLHQFHIPVMGTGHSIDSPIRVAHLGINSVVSIVDDLLLEKIRKYYSQQFDATYQQIPRNAEDGRARRITAYLDLMNDIVQEKFDQLKETEFFSESAKDRYFRLLPDTSSLKQAYHQLQEYVGTEQWSEKASALTNSMRPGSIDVNIMAKVDRLTYDPDGQPLSKEFSDASAALRGYAQSKLESAVVLSAGFNPRLYSYMSNFSDFYRDRTGKIKKKIILKVSDFRSALIQSKFLAKNGLEVSEYRIESGLNCGGHAFASDGELLPMLLKEFKEKREQLISQVRPMVKRYYEKMDWEYPEAAEEDRPSLTVQGGIGTHTEMSRLLDTFEFDGTGWGSPFLLVPEATCVDDPTMQLLQKAHTDDLYLSNVSPLGVPFNNVKNSGSQIWTEKQIEKDKPGSPCPKGFLQTNTEFTEQPICTASKEYQLLKIDQIRNSEQAEEDKNKAISRVVEKECLCRHLGVGALMKLGLQKESYGRQAICPSPNIAWFDRQYSLEEMVDHIYGRSESLVPDDRPHMYAKELTMYVDYMEELLERSIGTENEPDVVKRLGKMDKALREGMEYLLEVVQSSFEASDNMDSIQKSVEQAKERLEHLRAIA